MISKQPFLEENSPNHLQSHKPGLSRRVLEFVPKQAARSIQSSLLPDYLMNAILGCAKAVDVSMEITFYG
jgi:hypothetical protein